MSSLANQRNKIGLKKTTSESNPATKQRLNPKQQQQGSLRYSTV